MFDPATMKFGFVVVGVLSLLSGTQLILSHFLPADSKVTTIIQKILDFASANIKHG